MAVARSVVARATATPHALVDCVWLNQFVHNQSSMDECEGPQASLPFQDVFGMAGMSIHP
jgi:hypothetical protein